MEMAHKIAKQNIMKSCFVEKLCNVHNLNFQTFKPRDDVYLFFPRYKPVQSPKVLEGNVQSYHEIYRGKF